MDKFAVKRSRLEVPQQESVLLPLPPPVKLSHLTEAAVATAGISGTAYTVPESDGRAARASTGKRPFNNKWLTTYVCMSTCYSAPSIFLLRGAPDYSADTESEFHAEAHEQLRVKDLPRVPTRRLEVDSNPQPSGCKAPNIPLHHRAPQYIRG